MRKIGWAFALMIVSGCGGGASEDLGTPIVDASPWVDAAAEVGQDAPAEALPPDAKQDHPDALEVQDGSPDVLLDAAPEADSAADVQPETGPEADASEDAADEPEPAAELQPEAGPEASPEPQVEPAPEAGPEPPPEAGPDAADADSDVDADAAPDAAPDVIEAGPTPCPGFSSMILLPMGFCIDRTEVTVAAYRACVTSTACKAPTWQPGTSNYVQAGHDLHPMNWVDWNEASAYCLAQGKHLCGHVGGGPSNTAEAYVAGANEWYTACSSNGAHTYPYGDAYQAGKCNSSGSTEPVGNRIGCQPSSASYEGLMDFSGNVWEWEDSCFLSGTTMMCSTRGGGLSGTANDLRCDFRQDRAKTWAGLNTGFRCCLY